MIVTEHAARRIRQRMGIPRRSVDRVARCAVERGAAPDRFRGAFGRYLDTLTRTGARAVVYAGKVFVFDGIFLITVWPVPRQYRRVAGCA